VIEVPYPDFSCRQLPSVAVRSPNSLRPCTNILFDKMSCRSARPRAPAGAPIYNRSIRSSELVRPCASGLEPKSATGTLSLAIITLINQINSTNSKFGDPSRSRIKRSPSKRRAHARKQMHRLDFFSQKVCRTG
jgi:hypothetical protein